MVFVKNHLNDNYISGNYADMWISEGVLFGVYKDKVIIDLKAAEDILKKRELLSKGEKLPVIFDCRKVSYWTKEARKFQNTEMNYRLMKAAAVIYVDSYAPNIIINFILKFEKPLIPMKFFHSEEKALCWIKQFA